ncbi:MAG: hypothetical protein JO257_30300 [Deltaproteobacteria bacterium]|nr:hypothetical protein [Deltaproteobacteria bacterium]
MRKAAVLALVAACYRTSEWGATGEFRAQHQKNDEQQVTTVKQASFDEKDGLRATVVDKGMCRPLLLGDHIEQEQASTKELTGTGWLVTGSLITGALGAFGILFAAADANNQDVYGNHLPSRLSSTTRTELIIGGSALVLLAIGGVVAAVELPSERRNKRWIPVEGDPKQIFTAEDPVPCSAPATPVSGVEVTIEAKFGKGKPLAWTVATDASGTAEIDLDRIRTLAGWCGVALVTAKALDQTWTGPVEGQRTPLAQIQDDTLRSMAAGCQ